MSAASPFDTISKELETLHGQLGQWLQQPHRYPISEERRKALENDVKDISRQVIALRSERPYLVVMLMGGTGVGKSSLLNALARGTIAEAAFTRPTTREPIVYLHQNSDPERLDPALRHCRLVRHNQSGLEYKVLVDTPDLDSNETEHRDRFQAVLPTADIVLYVGSQEKYHDQAGWELFLQQRERRAFAFILNKWDRCLAASSTGLRPDQDLLRDLKQAGFSNPLLFRTCAYAWSSTNGPPRDLPEGEQFLALMAWLEQGLTKREIEAIRNKGIAQLVEQLKKTLQEIQPPDVQDAATKTWDAWRQTVRDEVGVQTDLLLACLAPHQKTIERRFSASIGHPFRGAMGLYARLLDFGRQGFFRPKLPQLASAGASLGSPGALDDVAGFGRACARDTFQRSLQARLPALNDRLVARADDAGLPINGLGADINSQLTNLTEETFASRLSAALHTAEHSLAGTSSWRKRSLAIWTWLGHTVPVGVLLLVFFWQLYAKFFTNASVSAMDLILLPPIAALLAMTLLYVIYRFTVPVTWSRLTPITARQIRQDLTTGLTKLLEPLPQQQARLLASERYKVQELLDQAQSISRLLQAQEQLGQIAVLYAK
jgi:hypothetical protein